MAYGFIRSITIDHTKCGSSDSTNFTILFSPGAVSSLKTVANGGHVQNSNGYDIIFTLDNLGTTPLFWEVESYDPTTGTMQAWVQVPTVSHITDTVIYCVYGNASISSFQGGSTGAAWDSNYAAVYHFTDNGSGGLLANDSTANGFNGTLINTPTLATGIVGKAAQFTGSSSQVIDAGNGSPLQTTGPFTIIAWVNFSGTQPGMYSGFASALDAAHSPLAGWFFGRFNGSPPNITFGQVYSLGTSPFTPTFAAANATWARLAFVFDLTTLYVYSSGQLETSVTGTLAATVGNFVMGGLQNGGGYADYLDGLLDEVSFSTSVRSADWLITDANSQDPTVTFYTLGSESTLGNQTVSPTAIASGQALGTTYIVVPGIGPDSVPSQQSFGTPSVSGGTITISPSTIPTPRAVGLPNIAGPVSPGYVPSQQSFGNPVLNAFQNVAPTSIASQQSFGTPVVSHSQQVTPTSVPSQQSLGTPAITGGPSFLLPASIPSQQSFGLPTLGGSYDGTLAVYVGGSIWPGQVMALGASDTAAPTTYESSNPPTIESQTLGRWVLNIDLGDDTGQFAPALSQTIVITEGGQKLFAGCIQTVGRQQLMAGSMILYHVVATDKSGICDRRLILTQTYPAGNDVAATILDIVANYLNGEGIITTPQSVKQDGSLGTLTADLTFSYVSVTLGFNQIATLSGTIWSVDTNGVLSFNAFDDLPAAPWGIDSTSDDYRGLLISETNIDKATEVYAVSNLNVLPGSGSGGGGGAGSGTGSNTETFVIEPGNIGVVYQISPVDGQSYCYSINVSLPIGTLYSVTVNGVVQLQIVNLEEWNGEVPTAAPQFGPWFWIGDATGGGTTVSAGLVGPSGLPTGATVVINYTPFSTNAAGILGEAVVPVNPATGDPSGTCGSGRYQLAVQVKNVSTTSDLNAIAAAELAKRNGTPVTVQFQTDRPGLKPGMLFTIDLPGQYLNSVSFLIISARGIAAAKELFYGSRFQWDIAMQSNEDPGNWVQYFANMLAQSANALPVYQYEDATFALGTGANLAGGLQATNPYQVKRTGQLLVMYAAAGTPPVDQNLVIQFKVNGTLISDKVIIPAGSAANTSFAHQFSTANPLFVFNTLAETDIVTVVTSYVVIGPNPIPASNVSATLRWRI
jgi:Concanavalin A-like lectin/glucanases superfamily